LKKLCALTIAGCLFASNISAIAEITEETVEYIPVSATQTTKIEAEDFVEFDGKVTDGIVSFTMEKVLVYNVNIPEDGYYDFSMYQGAIGAGVVEVRFDDVLKQVCDAVVTGDYNVYDAANIGAIKLTAGNYKLSLVAKTNMQLDYITITKTVPVKFRLQAEINDGINAGAVGTSKTTTTLHNANHYIDWKVDVEKAGVYEFKLNAYGYNNPSRPIIKVNGTTVIECDAITSDATACVEHIVGTAVLNAGENTITLYNPSDGYFTDGNTSSSMFVDWMEINRVSGITKFRLECENADEQNGGKAEGSSRWTLYNSNSYVAWNVDIEETGIYKFTINANGYLKTAKPVIFVNDTAAVYSAEILPDGYASYTMGTYGIKVGTYTIKLLNPSNNSFREGWISANMFADYVEIERVSGLENDVLEFEAADEYNNVTVKENAKDVSLYNTAAWAKWDINVAAGEYEFILRAGTNGTVGKPVLFVDDKFVAQGSVSSESWAKVDTSICKVYLDEGAHTVKVYNPQNAGTGENKDENGNGIYESSIAMSADSLTLNKVSNAGLTSAKKQGTVVAKANVEGYDNAVLIIAEYNENKLIAVSSSSKAVNGELEVSVGLSDEANDLKLFLWDGAETMVPDIDAKIY